MTSSWHSTSPPLGATTRPCVRGKFLFAGAEKLYVRGVTYGTFRPDERGEEFFDRAVVDADFRGMAAAGFNAVRTYTVPPSWLLDVAGEHGLRVMVGIPWEQHIAFLDDRDRSQAIEQRVRVGVRACAAHPSILCYTIGNEIPASIVRWHGPRRIERFLERLYRAAKAEDPEGLVTYVNYPSTEYLYLPFVDFLCFNVYLESQDRLEAYLARLQNLANHRPLVMAEIGLDSRGNGEGVQAEVLDWQIRATFGAGCAGIFLFAWTDEWHRGGYDIEDWDFGITDRARRPKRALDAVCRAWADVPYPADTPWPRISVVVCSHNGARTIGDTCRGLCQLHYPDYEVIVVDDGSTDATAVIAREAGFRVISTDNRGLSAARNTGMEAATGDIVAYCDDDARPDPEWLKALAVRFLRTNHVGIGGPNIAPPGDGWIADCIANAPGGPVHVLLTDELAEHIPGCNMAYRKEALQAIGGFDPTYRVAGDDVDICWRLQDRGWTLGFSPAAVVWHHRRNSLRAYWKQQCGYGKAEALLARKWPEKYNFSGHLDWAGRVYSYGPTRAILPPGRIYGGISGTAPFQRLYEPTPGALSSLPLMPEWYLVILLLGALSLLGLAWEPLISALPLLAIALAVPIAQAILSASQAHFTTPIQSRVDRLEFEAVTALLHLVQPLARLKGRLLHGLTPWREHGRRKLALPLPANASLWSEHWQAAETWLDGVRAALRPSGAVSWYGNEFDRWDLETRCGTLGSARLLISIEEHGGGKQLLRLRVLPRVTAPILLVSALFLALTATALSQRAMVAGAVLAAATLILIIRTLYDLSTAVAAVRAAMGEMDAG